MNVELEGLSDLFKALSEETRLQILALLLWSGERCVCDIENTLDITQSKASRHLRYLYHAGLVLSRREGLWTYYRIPDEPGEAQREVLELLRGLLSQDQLPDLKNKLDEWLKRKGEGALVCRE